MKEDPSTMKKNHSLHELGLLRNGAVAVTTIFIMVEEIVPATHGASHSKNFMRNEKHVPGVIINI